jgi:DNA-binding MarR family transcriptional regulator
LGHVVSAANHLPILDKQQDCGPAVKEQYLESIHLIERLHRQFLEVVKGELERQDIQDVNNVQAVILYNIGKDELTVGELTNRGYYLGSNVSYNVRKMVENHYLIQERSTHDRRSVRVRLSDKGIELHELLDNMFAAQAEKLGTDITTPQDLDTANALLRRLERFWIAAMNFPVRATF